MKPMVHQSKSPLEAGKAGLQALNLFLKLPDFLFEFGGSVVMSKGIHRAIRSWRRVHMFSVPYFFPVTLH